jgi:hypothetical protein
MNCDRCNGTGFVQVFGLAATMAWHWYFTTQPCSCGCAADAMRSEWLKGRTEYAAMWATEQRLAA